MSDLVTAITAAITETMTEKSVTTTQLAGRSGLSTRRLRRLLGGALNRGWTADDIEAIARALGVPLADLLLPKPKPFRNGHRVRFIGISGTKSGPIGSVSMTVKAGVLVRWDHDRTVRELVHPDSLRLLTAAELSAPLPTVRFLCGCTEVIETTTTETDPGRYAFDDQVRAHCESCPASVDGIVVDAALTGAAVAR